MATLKQRTSFGPGIYRGIKFSLDRLRSFVDGTNKAIAAGVPIPLLKVHAKINASDKETEQFANDAGQGAGWLRKVGLGDDGSLEWEADSVPDEIARGVTEGTLRCTSPEFRNHYETEKAGIYSGPIIRHIAFTPKPGNPIQGPIETVALQELGVFQFNEFDYEGQQFGEGILDEAIWDKAKKEVDRSKYNSDDSYYAVVSTVYKKMGGKYKNKDSQHSEYDWTEEVKEFPGFADYLKEIETEQFAHREAADKALASELMNVHGQVRGNQKQYGFIGQQHDAITKNLDRKKKRGIYDHEKAKKLFGYYAKGLSDHYAKHYGGLKANPATRHHVASMLADAYHGSQHGEDNPSTPAGENPIPAANPDMPPVSTDRNKVSAVIAGLAQKNIVLPSDFDFTDKAAIDILLAAINSSIKATNEAEAELAPADPDNEPVTDTSMPFSEQFAEHHIYDHPTAFPFKGQIQHDASGVGHNWKTIHPKDLQSNVMEHLADEHGQVKHGATANVGGMQYRAIAAKIRKRKLPGTQHNETPVGESLMAVQFTEEELAALPGSIRTKLQEGDKALKEAETKAQQFEEEKRTQLNNSAKETAIAAVKSAKIPPSLRNTLLSGYGPTKGPKGEDVEAVVQFEEGNELPVYTAQQVAAMVANSLPPHLQFSEDKDITDSKPPKGQKLIGHDAKGQPVYTKDDSGEQFFEMDGEVPTGHVSRERAEEILASSPAFRSQSRKGRVPSTAEDVARINQEHPNRMMG